jgi:RNA polymerase sigma-70 factor (ECF subfamily)
MQTESDQALIERIRGRDESAMATLYDKYNRLVYTVSLRVLGEPQAAEDLQQEVFMRVWRKPDMQVSENGMAAWFAVVARNRSIDVIRQRKNFIDVDTAVMAIQMAFFEGLTHTEIAERTGLPLGTVKTRIRSAVQSLRKAMTA